MEPMQWAQLLCTHRCGDGEDERDEGDLRTPFERDYGRVLFSTPVRRLQDKAQVFPLESHDAVRTRLTHSHEVSSVAKSLADSVGRELPNGDKVHAGNISAIAATCGLAHDLGNPPFGHAGESAIAAWFRDRCDKDAKFKAHFDQLGAGSQREQDFVLFDGNPQTIRLLTHLQVVSDRHGLDLTCGTISAACKYVPPSHLVDRGRHTYKKPGFFASENEIVRDVGERTGTSGRRNPITLLVEAADDAVYATVDLEDGMKKGLLTWTDVEAFLRHEARGDEVVLRTLDRTVKRTSGMGEATDGSVQEARAQVFRTFAIGAMLMEAKKAFFQNYDAIMRGDFDDALIPSSAASRLSKACTDLAKRDVFTSEGILQLEVMGYRIIHDLLGLFWDAVSKYSVDEPMRGHFGKVYQLMSPNYRTVFQEDINAAGVISNDGASDFYARARLVTDYICGMTDTFAQSLHQRLFNG